MTRRQHVESVPRLYYPADMDHLKELLAAAAGSGRGCSAIVGVIHGVKGAEAFDLSLLALLSQMAGLCADAEMVVACDDFLTPATDAHGVLDATGIPVDRLVDVPAELQVQGVPKGFSLRKLSEPAAAPQTGQLRSQTLAIEWKSAIQRLLKLLGERFQAVLVVHGRAVGRHVYGVLATAIEASDMPPFTLLGSVSIPARLESHLPVEDIAKYWQVGLWSRSPLPKWEPYDHISHFLNYGWPDFERRQAKAACVIADVLKTHAVEEVHDVGCGSGEILHHLRVVLLDQRNSVPRLYAYDPSEWQARTTAARMAGTGLQVKTVGLDQVKCSTKKHSLVMMLGNTLAHVGAKAFRQWLTASDRPQPEYLLFDFAENWRELLYQAEPEVICGPLKFVPTLAGTAVAHMTTAGGPGWVKRGIVVQFLSEGTTGEETKNENTLDPDEHRLFTKQFADPPETYFTILRAHGYDREGEPTEYVSGWGKHMLYLYRRGVSASIDWLEPNDDEDWPLNQVWYEALCETWQALSEPSGPAKVEFFPAALLPFGQKRIYARYVPRNPQERDGKLKDLFGATMWLVDPRDPTLRHAGAPKMEDVLPYAPSIYRATLGTVPASVIEHFDKTADELRIDVNASDLELADLERRWIGSGEGEAAEIYYALPVFVHGLPCYLAIVRVQDVTGLKTGAPEVSNRLRDRRDELAGELEKILSTDKLRSILKRWEETIKGDYGRLRTLLDRVAQYPWTSWLDVFPGQSALGDGPFGQDFRDLRKLFLRQVSGLRRRSAHTREGGTARGRRGRIEAKEAAKEGAALKDVGGPGATDEHSEERPARSAARGSALEGCVAYTATDAAREVGVDPKTIRNWIRGLVIWAEQVPGGSKKYYFSLEELKAQKTATTQKKQARATKQARPSRKRPSESASPE